MSLFAWEWNCVDGVVFVGGAAAGLLITDLAAPTIRRTDDVDIVDPALVLE